MQVETPEPDPGTSPNTDPRRLAERYVALWNEPDPSLRRRIIRELWAPDGEHILEPPQAMRDAAQLLGFESPLLAIRGYAALEARATRAYEEFVASGRYVFRSRGNAARLRNVVKFNWEGLSPATSQVIGVGLDVLVLDAGGRILIDYQFIES